VHSLFNQFISAILHAGNPMGWSLHSLPIQKAVHEGIVERINAKSGRSESREQFLLRIRSECLDEDQWLQEYCCVPSDKASAFLSPDLLAPASDPSCLKSFDYLASAKNPLFLGVDVARKSDLCVLDVGEKIGDLVYDRFRLEFSGDTFATIERELFRLLRLPQLRRACIDATGLGLQLAERARELFPSRVEPVTFSAAVKEEIAYALRSDFESRLLRISPDEQLAADLRAVTKEITSSGNIRFTGQSADSHCDRFWAKALRQHAAHHRPRASAMVG